MPLPRPLSALLTTIVAAVPAAITTVVLNKPKPPREIDKVIELDENTETISEPEIIPKEAPAPSTPPPPPVMPSVLQHSNEGEQGAQEGFVLLTDDPKGEEDLETNEDAGTEEEEKADEKDPPEQQQEDKPEDDEKQDNDEENTTDPQQPPENKSLSEDEIKKALLEVIKSLSEKQGLNLQTADLYPLFKVNFEIGQLISLIKQLEDLKKKQKSEAAGGNGGSAAGVGAPKETP